jgi:transposase
MNPSGIVMIAPSGELLARMINFSKPKPFRRVATRFEKTARNHRAIVTIAATALWIR